MIILGLFITLFFQISWGSQIIELNHILGPESPIYPIPGYVKFRMESVYEDYNPEGNIWLAIHKFYVHEHTGTHLNAPILFNPFGLYLNEIPLSWLFGPAAVFDIREKVKSNSTYGLSKQDVKDWVDKNGVFQNNSIVIVNTGWDSRWPDQEAFFGGSDITKLVHPGISLEAVQEIYNYRKSHGIHINVVGSDGPNIDIGPNYLFTATRFLSSQDVLTLEMLTNLDKLPAVGARISIMPMKIRRGTGAPARVIARLQ